MQVDFHQGQLHIQLDKRFDGKPVHAFLEQDLQLPGAFVRKLLAKGLVRAGGRTLVKGGILTARAKLILTDPTSSSHRQMAGVNSAPLPVVLFEDDHILVVSKPAGMIVHDDASGGSPTLDDCVALYYEQTGQERKVLHVHRLDRPTTGAVLYAKHGFVARALDAQLQVHDIERTYFAIVYGKKQPARQTVEWRIGRDRHRSGAYRVSSKGKLARTYFHVRQASVSDGQYLSWLECQLATGRTHQIRVHAMAAGAPIIGDELYGGKDLPPFSHVDGQIALHANSVTFYHPYDECKITVQCKMDPVWMSFLRQHCWIEKD